ncbi:hypothetical protein NC651_018760 [Populus alba x Populus x berolinensis]|nr:hypothetical protein NC651_018760 [Populus alba x Populus x berolinensis]
MHVRNLIDENRKKLNKERLDDSLLAKPFIESAFNFARQAHCAYQNGDGHSSTLSDLIVLLMRISGNTHIIHGHTNENNLLEKFSSIIYKLLINLSVINILMDLHIHKACKKQLSAEHYW